MTDKVRNEVSKINSLTSHVFKSRRPHRRLQRHRFFPTRKRVNCLYLTYDHFIKPVQRFFQEFIQNPLLIDGHAFELGVYALITSMDPLIIYKWNSDILLRFCPEPYQPFDRKNVNKYVVGDNHIPSWEMPSLMNATQGFNISVLDALNHHLTKEGQDTSKFWKQVEDAMISITFSKTSLITRFMNIFKEKNPGLSRGFFELLKFDFLIDDKLHIHLMEVRD